MAKYKEITVEIFYRDFLIFKILPGTKACLFLDFPEDSQ